MLTASTVTASADAGKEDVVRIDAEQAAALGHDVAPGRGLRRNADAEEGQDRLYQNRGRADERALHDHRRDGVGQDVADQQERGRRAGHDGGLDIGLLAHREHDRAHQPHHARDFRHRDRDDHAQQTGAEQGHDRDREQDGGDRHQPVHQPHHHHVEPADVAGNQADHEPDGDADQRDREADEERDAGAIDHAAVDVAAEAVGAHAVLEHRGAAVVVADRLLVARHAVAERRIDLGRVLGAEERRDESDDDHQQHDRRAEDDAAVACEPRQHARFRARALRRLGGDQDRLGAQ